MKRYIQLISSDVGMEQYGPFTTEEERKEKADALVEEWEGTDEDVQCCSSSWFYVGLLDVHVDGNIQAKEFYPFMQDQMADLTRDIVAVDIDATKCKLKRTWWQTLFLMIGWGASIGYVVGCQFAEDNAPPSAIILIAIFMTSVLLVWKNHPTSYNVEYKPYQMKW